MGFYGLDHPNPHTPQFAYPRRGGAKLSGTCIIHTSESALDVIGDDSGAEDVAAFCMRRADYGCYHTIVDSDSIVEVYPYEYETWQDSETNNWAVGLSNACRTTDWVKMAPRVSEGYYRNLAFAAADFVTYMKEAYNITVPLRRLSGAEARARVAGFCAHGDSGIARSDPGRDFDWGKFFQYTKEALEGKVDDVGNVDNISDHALNQIADRVMSKEVPWYGFNGQLPPEGSPRRTTNLGIQIGWLDTQFTAAYAVIGDVQKAVKEVLDGLKELPEVDNAVIDQLGEQLESRLRAATENFQVVLKAQPPTD